MEIPSSRSTQDRSNLQEAQWHCLCAGSWGKVTTSFAPCNLLRRSLVLPMAYPSRRHPCGICRSKNQVRRVSWVLWRQHMVHRYGSDGMQYSPRHGHGFWATPCFHGCAEEFRQVVASVRPRVPPILLGHVQSSWDHEQSQHSRRVASMPARGRVEFQWLFWQFRIHWYARRRLPTEKGESHGIHIPSARRIRLSKRPQWLPNREHREGFGLAWLLVCKCRHVENEMRRRVRGREKGCIPALSCRFFSKHLPDIIDWHILVQVRNCIGMEGVKCKIGLFLENLLPFTEIMPSAVLASLLFPLLVDLGWARLLCDARNFDTNRFRCLCFKCLSYPWRCFFLGQQLADNTDVQRRWESGCPCDPNRRKCFCTSCHWIQTQCQIASKRHDLGWFCHGQQTWFSRGVIKCFLVMPFSDLWPSCSPWHFLF